MNYKKNNEYKKIVQKILENDEFLKRKKYNHHIIYQLLMQKMQQ